MSKCPFCGDDDGSDTVLQRVCNTNICQKVLQDMENELARTKLQNDEMRDLLISVNQAYTLTFGGNRGSMEAMFKTIDKYLKEQKIEKPPVKPLPT